MSIDSTLRQTVIPLVLAYHYQGPPFGLKVAYHDADRNDVSFRVVSLSLLETSNGGEKEIVVPISDQTEVQLIKRKSYNTFSGDVIVSERRYGEVRLPIQEHLDGNVKERFGVRAKVELVNASGGVDELILQTYFQLDDRSGITTFWKYATSD